MEALKNNVCEQTFISSKALLSLPIMSVFVCGKVVAFFHLTMLQIKESLNRLCTRESRKTKISLHKALFLSSPVADWPPSVLVYFTRKTAKPEQESLLHTLLL